MSPLEEVVETINDHLKGKEYAFELSAPAKLTVQVKDGFRKKSFAGGETMIALPEIRIGKRNDIIFVFRVVEGGAIVEMRSPDASRLLIDFTATMNHVVGGGYESMYKAAQRGSRRHKTEERRQAISEIAKTYPRYGTWLARSLT